MYENNPAEHSFTAKLVEIILENCEKVNFDVNELSQTVGMTSYALRRKLKAISKKTINQLIREVRLQKAMEILQQEEITASEVAYKVGFGSPAYFTRCFHDYFGYPPGEVKERVAENLKDIDVFNENNAIDDFEKPVIKKIKTKKILIIAGGILAIFIVYLFVNNLSFESFSILPGKRLNPEDKSIVVLVLQNLNGDEENTHFAYGISENILTNLLKIKGIKVINSLAAVTSDNPDDLKIIAKENNVRFIFSGSVQQSGDSVIIIPKLIDSQEYEVIWSKPYNDKLTDIFQVTSNLAQQVALKLQTVITKYEKEQIEKVPTTSREAHDYYVMGCYLLEKRPWPDIDTNKYITPFKKAIIADPNYAEAYAGLANAYLTMTRSISYPRPEGYIMAKKNVLKALELDNNLAEAHATLGAILCWHEWNWEVGRIELEKAIELNPNNALTNNYYASILYIMRKMKLSRFHVLLAMELNPISPRMILNKASLFIEEDKPDEAMNELRKIIEMYPDFYEVYYYLWHLYIKNGENRKAMESLQKAFQLVPENKPFADTIEAVYNKQGIEGLEKWYIEHCIKYDSKRNWENIVIYYNKIGVKEKALEWLEKAYNWQIPNLPDINGMSELDSLRNEPRFQVLLFNMGLTPYQ